MSDRASILEDIAATLAPYGLVPRGVLVFGEGCPLPATMTDSRFRSVVVVGHFGSSPWPHFTRWWKDHPGAPDPLDQWSKEVLTFVGARFGATAVFPSDKPYLPFQQWAMHAEGLRPSPLGILIHPRYGLWHAFRGALLFEHVIDVPDAGPTVHPCDRCEDKPCLSACPAVAFQPGEYDVVRCRTHLSSEQGNVCLSAGCLARSACPVGQQYAYIVPQMQFHMAAFANG